MLCVNAEFSVCAIQTLLEHCQLHSSPVYAVPAMIECYSYSSCNVACAHTILEILNKCLDVSVNLHMAYSSCVTCAPFLLPMCWSSCTNLTKVFSVYGTCVPA